MTARDQRRLAAIVSTDVVGYSLLMGRDESGTLARLKGLRQELFDPKIAEYGGRIVKTTGDGLLLEFPSVVDAVRCAVDVQRGLADRNAGAPDLDRILLRIGINVGDIIIDDGDIFGDGVNVAARLQTLAEPGGICVSRAVRDQVLDKLSFAFEDLGPQEVKNIARPVEVFRVALDSAAAPRPVVGALAIKLQPSRHAPARWILAAVVLVAIGTSGWWAFERLRPPTKVAPYSVEDRRMTFAVIPFEGPSGDAAGGQVATTMTEAATAIQENRSWARVAPRRKVDEALARNVSPRELGRALDVHFLIRGHVAKAPSGGYVTELQMVDTATERILGARTLAVPEGATTPRDPIELKNGLGNLTFLAVKSEADRARGKADADLDVRDLTFRAWVDWGSASREDARASYYTAMALLDRARKQAPDDILAMRIVAEINLCACINGWSTNIAEQQAIGAAALEDWLRHDPTSTTALAFKANLYALRGQYDDAIVIGDAILKREPQSAAARYVKADALLHLGRPLEAKAALGDLLERDDDAEMYALAAAIDYTIGRNDLAAEEARRAVALMNAEDLRNRTKGAAMLTLIAAEARLGHADRAKAARAKFTENAPGVDTIADVKAWMQPTAKLVGYEPLFEGLRLAGFGN